MPKENAGLEYRLKNRWNKELSLRRNKHSDLISGKHKKTWRLLNYFQHFLLFISASIGYVSISDFT